MMNTEIEETRAQFKEILRQGQNDPKEADEGLLTGAVECIDRIFITEKTG